LELYSYLEEYNKIRREIIENDVNKFLTNPINEYILVGRLAEWNKINELIANMNSSRSKHFDWFTSERH
jgi:DNA-binding transcriptional regulator/RsmH inhibitor MraZ